MFNYNFIYMDRHSRLLKSLGMCVRSGSKTLLINFNLYTVLLYLQTVLLPSIKKKSADIDLMWENELELVLYSGYFHYLKFF